MIVKNKHKLTNCLGCGRDTTMNSCYCTRCIPIGIRGTMNRAQQMPSEEKDRKPFQIDGDSIMQTHFECLEDDYDATE